MVLPGSLPSMGCPLDKSKNSLHLTYTHLIQAAEARIGTHNIRAVTSEHIYTHIFWKLVPSNNHIVLCNYSGIGGDHGVKPTRTKTSVVGVTVSHDIQVRRGFFKKHKWARLEQVSQKWAEGTKKSPGPHHSLFGVQNGIWSPWTTTGTLT